MSRASVSATAMIGGIRVTHKWQGKAVTMNVSEKGVTCVRLKKANNEKRSDKRGI